MPSRLKEMMVDEYSQHLNAAGDMFAISYTGLRVSENNRLRTELFESGNRLMHVRNRVFKIALENVGLEDFVPFVDGPTGIVFGENIINGIKIVTRHIKEHEGIELKGGSFEGRIITSEEVEALSRIPSREVLISQVMSAVQGPVSGLASLFQTLVRKLVLTVKEIEKTK